jgi:hypothetical protein
VTFSSKAGKPHTTKENTMNTKTTEANLRPTIIGLAFAAMVVSGQASAYDIDHEIASAYDTAVENSSLTTVTVPRSNSFGYKTEIVLDESYHDYQTGEAIVYETNTEGLEKTEFAAFEPVTISIFSHNIPWELQVVD